MLAIGVAANISVDPPNFLRILLRCNGFAGIQKSAVGRMGSRPPNSDHDLFWCNFGASSRSNHWTSHHWLSYKIHFPSHLTVQLRNGSLLLHRMRWHFKMTFFTFNQLMRYPLIELFHLSNLSQMPNNSRVVDTEFLGNFSYDPLNWSLPTFNGWQLCSSSSKLLPLLQNFLNHHCTVCSLVVPGPNALLMLWVVSIALWLILNSNKKIPWICFCLTSFS